ncbi:MAG TPA: response regulator [Cyclobacteriaceae bacterium]|nr:response regulator [Cyclobacteriaceae bacterium]
MNPALKITFIYILIGGSWFVFSSIYMDEIMHWLGLSNPMILELIKALFFVLISGILIYILVTRSFRFEKQIGKVYKLFFEKMPNWIFVLSLEDQRILMANDAALQHFDIAETDFGEKYFNSFFEDYKNLSKSRVNQSRVIRNLIMIDKNYDPRHVDVFSMPFVFKGADCVMALAVDNTEIHQSLLENVRLNESLTIQNQQLRDFSFINSHHIRSHLANILGIISLSNDKENLPGEIMEMLQVSAGKLDQEIRKVNNLLKENDSVMKNDSLEQALNRDRDDRVIVFVDDDKVQHMINKRILLKVDPNLTLIFFENPTMALEWLSSNKADILLLDINMPEMRGWELLDALERKGISIEVKMLTSSMAPEDLEESKNYHMVSGFLNKPLKEEEVEVFINAN